MTLKDTIKNVVYLTDMADFTKVNQVYTQYYGGEGAEYPARTCIAIKALPKGGLVEIESVFFKPKTIETESPQGGCCRKRRSC
jgi:2-iminobutanoate/2-iminopropanoate deaminase